ncbi:MAG: fructose-6-phosphate aldolase [Saprospiraceae bacterium]
MEFFLDTANLDEIAEARDLGVLDGVTTNPSLMAKEGISGRNQILKHYKAICDLVGDGEVSAEVIATDFEGMVREGEELAEIADNIVVKIPMIKDGVKALRHFSEEGIRTNCTLVFSTAQAILAAKAGADFVSPFIGRIDDTNWDGMSLISEIAEVFAIQDYDTYILAASIRTSRHIVEAAKAGADVVTCPLRSILGMLTHPLTDSGLKKFLEDFHRTNPS